MSGKGTIFSLAASELANFLSCLLIAPLLTTKKVFSYSYSTLSTDGLRPLRVTYFSFEKYLENYNVEQLIVPANFTIVACRKSSFSSSSWLTRNPTFVPLTFSVCCRCKIWLIK